MTKTLNLVLAMVAAATVAATNTKKSLADVCRKSYVQKSMPPIDVLPGVSLDYNSVSADAFYNVSVANSVNYPDATFDYCNVTFAYLHHGTNNKVHVTYWLPAPNRFQNRFLSTGGGGFAINNGNSSVAGGLPYGAVAGLTDGGFGGFLVPLDQAFPSANGTPNWEGIYMFGYQAIHEMTVIGKSLTRLFFDMDTNKTLYTYYQGCSEGGREGWSQIQRYGTQFDGVVVGAPAIRFSFQQVGAHLWSNVVEKEIGYYPPPCELEKLVNETIAGCDHLDGKVDGVVARTDLCKLTFNLTSTIGTSYHCPPVIAQPSKGIPGYPEQRGHIAAKGVEVAEKILHGPVDSLGRRIYVPYQPTASFSDAQTQYNTTTKTWVFQQQAFGVEWVARFLNLQNTSVLPESTIFDANMLKSWIIEGWQRYADSLETTWPDLTTYHASGGKILQYHGESDSSIPAAASTRYYDSVRRTMYPNLSYHEGAHKLSRWYKLYLVPGAGHCGPNSRQPNGPFPQTNLQVMIGWVEKDIEPATLNATVLQGQSKGENRQICQWPSRPYWTKSGKEMICKFDSTSINTWSYDLDAFNIPVY